MAAVTSRANQQLLLMGNNWNIVLGWYICWRSHATIVTWKGYKVWNANFVTQGRLLW